MEDYSLSNIVALAEFVPRDDRPHLLDQIEKEIMWILFWEPQLSPSSILDNRKRKGELQNLIDMKGRELAEEKVYYKLIHLYQNGKISHDGKEYGKLGFWS